MSPSVRAMTQPDLQTVNDDAYERFYCRLNHKSTTSLIIKNKWL